MLALTVQRVVNAGLSGGNVIPWAGLLLALCGGVLALQLWGRWYGGQTRDLLTKDLRWALTEILLVCRYDAAASRHSGDLVSRLGEDVSIVCGEAVSLLPALMGSGVRLLGTLVALAWLSRPLALALLGAGATLGIAAALIRVPLKRLSREVREAESQVRAGLQESLNNRETVKSLQMEREVLRREECLMDRALEARDRQRLLSILGTGGLEIVWQVGYCIVLVWGVSMAACRFLDFGTLTAILQLLLQLRGPVGTLSGILPRLSMAAASNERLAELEELEEEPEGTKLPQDIQVWALIFSHVDFRYPGDDRPVLRDFSLRMEAGKWACLSGASGKGKSTVFRLALGLYCPQAGEVFLETNRGKLPCGKATRRLLSYVPQDHTLFSGTIRENLLMADPEATETALWAALEIACAAEFVKKLPLGLDTPLLERGGGLSRGQGQRIALARAVLLDAPILLLDECTSALDRATERMVLEHLETCEKGALLSSHHPDALPEGTEVIQMKVT